jgi:hypothetical protein
MRSDGLHRGLRDCRNSPDDRDEFWTALITKLTALSVVRYMLPPRDSAVPRRLRHGRKLDSLHISTRSELRVTKMCESTSTPLPLYQLQAGNY